MSKTYISNYNELDCLRGIAQKLGGNASTKNELGALRTIVTRLNAVPEGRYLGNMNEIQCLRAIVGSYTNPGLHPECTALLGETGLTLVLPVGSAGKYYRYRRRATNSSGTAYSWSNAIGPITVAQDINANLTQLTGTQEGNGWSAGRLATPGDASTFTIAGMAWNAGNARWEGPGDFSLPFVATSYGFPSDSAGSAAARYTASSGGTVTVTASANVDAGSSDGVDIRVFKNTTQIISYHLAPGGSNSVNTSVAILAGDTVTIEVGRTTSASGDLTFITEFSIVE